MHTTLEQAAYRLDHDYHDIISSDPQGTPDSRVPCLSVATLFPSTRGVVEFVARDGACVLLAATGHIRDFIAQRLGQGERHGEQGDLRGSPRANLAPVTARIAAYPTGSAFESDLLLLTLARTRDAALHAKLCEQNRRALLVLDEATGTWRAAETLGLELASSEHAIGPVLSVKGATSLGEALDDVFELCRYPKELALAPSGTPCAYKQMGRCPGACDGSEPLGAYHARFGQAIAAAGLGVEAWARRVRQEIGEASQALDFERAQLLKRGLDQIEKLPLDGLRHAGALGDFTCVCVTPAFRKGWALVWAAGDRGCVPLVAVEGAPEPGLEALVSGWAEPLTLAGDALEAFALLTRHWFTKPAKARRRRVTVLDRRDPDWARGLPAAIEAAQNASDPGHGDEEHTHVGA